MKILRKYILPISALATVLLFIILPYESTLVERWYSQGLYKIYRIVYDALLGWIPIPIIYLWLAGWLFFLYKRCRSWRSTGWALVQMLSVHIIVFYWCWAYNYKRVDHIHRLVDTSQEISTDDIYAELRRVTDSLTHMRPVISSDGRIVWDDIDMNPEAYRGQLEMTLDAIGLPQTGEVNVRLLYPRGSLLRWSTAGVYLPWAGEGHVDPGLHRITWPFTMTHEMSHGYGYTSEDDCNFLALLTCINSDDPVMRYCGYYSYWRYLRANAYRADREQFASYWETVPQSIKDDLIEINAYSDRYPDIMPMVRDLFYDRYLRSHGVSEGLRSYSRIIVQAISWRRQYGSMTNVLEE